MNTFIRGLIVVLAVVLLHIIIWVTIFHSPEDSKEKAPPVAAASPAVTPPAQTAPAVQPPTATHRPASAVSPVPAVANNPASATPANQHSAVPTAPPLTARLTPQYYQRRIGKLPVKVAKKAALCRSGIVIDLDRHTILWEKNSTKVYPIASLTKMMTSILLMERIESDPAITLQSTLAVQKEDIKRIRNAHINGIYLSPGEELTLDDYLKSMIICSANDAAIVVARFLGKGDYNAGVAMLNRRAAEFGLRSMKFYNPNGLPIDDAKQKRIENQGSALELAFLAEQCTRHPAIMKWAGTAKATLRENTKPFDLHATNHLLRSKETNGITGLKTGYTKTAGYCIALTAQRNGRNMLVIVMGVISSTPDYGKQRNSIASALMDWAYTQP